MNQKKKKNDELECDEWVECDECECLE